MPEEYWLLQSHAREGMLLEHYSKGPGNLASLINNFLKLSCREVVTRNTSAFSIPSPLFGVWWKHAKPRGNITCTNVNRAQFARE